jgi:hypothetical protein
MNAFVGSSPIKKDARQLYETHIVTTSLARCSQVTSRCRWQLASVGISPWEGVELESKSHAD